jgi:outer membrane phospholipase A
MLEPWERDYLYAALARLQKSCARRDASGEEAVTASPYRLTTRLDDGVKLEFHAAQFSGEAASLTAIAGTDSGNRQQLQDCEPGYAAPIIAVIQSKQVESARALALAANTPAANEEPEITEQPITVDVASAYPRERLNAYEQNHLGWTRDDNSVESGYMDAQMSFKFRAWEGGTDDRFAAFFAFSTRFSQYIETIESSPVVGKRYNPLIFLRTNGDKRQGYLDIGLAHESNGQSITTEESYVAERRKYADSDGEPDFARNSISRGWDYVFTDWTHCWLRCSDNYAIDGLGRFTTKLEFQYYLDDGPFQGNPEEYNDWEGGSEQHRKEYDGIGLTSDFRINSGCLGIDGFGCSISWEYRTGYDGVFDNSTNRLQLAVDKFWILPPIGFWVQTGYNSSLVDYYRSVDSVGIAMLFSNPY